MATVFSPNNVDYQWPAGRTNVYRRHSERSSIEHKKVNSTGPMVVLAIPCYNEEIAIGSILIRASKFADRIVVIDDGSIDRTIEIAREAGVDVIIHEKNEGKGASIRDAFSFAKEVGADILVLIDGDGQHDPGEIPSLIEPILKGEADMVNGSRFLAKGHNNVPKYRRVGQEVLTMATNAGGNCNVTDSQNGFRAFYRNTFDCFSFQQNGMAIESEMLMDAVKADLDIKEVQINVRYDVAGSTLNPVTHGFGVLNSIIMLVSQRRPLLFFSLPGSILLTIGALFFLATLNVFNETHSISPVYAMVGMLCVIIGTFSVFTGMTLASIKNIRAKVV
jgi:glycosyltransferase involved in cell wall biosynthesis